MEQAKYDVFISYSRKDYVVNDKIIPGNPISAIQELFDKNNVKYWFDKDGISGGDQFMEIIVDAIEASKMVLFISSVNSNNSKWAAGELMEASNNGKMIIPFKIDNSNYNKRYRMLLLPFDYIDYFNNKDAAMQQLLKAVLKAKEEYDNLLRLKEKQKQKQEEEVLRKQALIEIQNLSLDYQKIELDQEKIWNSIIEKCNKAGVVEKQCPVCNNRNLIAAPYCQICGWRYSKLYGITKDIEETDNTTIEIARNHWHAYNNKGNLEKELSACKEELKRLRNVNEKQSANSRKSQNTNKTHTDDTTDMRKLIIKRFISNMIHIEGGEFSMGASREQNSGTSTTNNYPQHTVKLRSYRIGKYPVTQEEWTVIMDYNPSKFKGNRNPVESVSWEDCQEFIKRLNKLSRRSFRLPTEAEWEFAARGGIKSKNYIYSGSNNADSVCWHKDNSGNSTVEVGLKMPNELGIYDMCGNVCEWCQDYLGNYHSWRETNPKGPTFGNWKVFRGGCWNDDKHNCKVPIRFAAKPSDKGIGLGFRLALNE